MDNETYKLVNADELREMRLKIDEILRMMQKSEKTPVKKLNNKWLDAKETCMVLKCSLRSLHKYMHDGLIPRRRSGGKLYFLVDDLEKFLEGRYGKLDRSLV